ncbi:ABC transporter ATP-binding protein [soil metagenome]
MFGVLRSLLRLMSPRERRRLPWLLGAILLMALFQTVTIASIMPFLAVVTQPDIVETHRYFRLAYVAAGSPEIHQFLFLLGVLILISLLISNLVSVAVTWLLLRFSHMVGYRYSRRILRDYLHRPYSFFLGRNSAELGKNILSETDRVTRGVLLPLLLVVTRGVSIAFIVGLLVIVDPVIAAAVGTVLGAAYFAIYMSIRRRAFRLGRVATEASRERFKVTSEAFGVIKYLKLSGMEDRFVERYSAPSRRHARSHAKSRAMAQLPRYLLEVIAFGGILVTVLYVITMRGGMQETLSLLALYAFAGYRLLPQLQQVFDVATNLRFNMPALDVLLADYDPTSAIRAGEPTEEAPLLELKNALQLDHVTYTYPGAENPTIEDLSIIIPVGSTIGLAGATGAGKTTVADILLGLLAPDSGKFLIDGRPLDPLEIRSWQRRLGYVPQQVYLSDESISSNIAFGVPEAEIDRAAIERAAEVAQIRDFIVQDLPDGFETSVGERGVRLSGGEQQRIGIARALYRSPQVLMLDEATGALDTVTERAVLEAIAAMQAGITVIMITHRLSTLSACDVIYLLEGGRVSASGSFTQLVQKNPRFAGMAVAT